MNNGLLTLLVLVAAANLLSFIAVGLDKSRSISGNSRISEVYFFFWSLFFSSFGVLLGMVTFHHKTKKLYFTTGIGLVLIQQAILVLLLYEKLQ